MSDRGRGIHRRVCHRLWSPDRGTCRLACGIGAVLLFAACSAASGPGRQQPLARSKTSAPPGWVFRTFASLQFAAPGTWQVTTGIPCGVKGHSIDEYSEGSSTIRSASSSLAEGMTLWFCPEPTQRPSATAVLVGCFTDPEVATPDGATRQTSGKLSGLRRTRDSVFVFGENEAEEVLLLSDWSGAIGQEILDSVSIAPGHC